MIKDLYQCSKYELSRLIDDNNIKYDFTNKSRLSKINVLLENGIHHYETPVVYPENTKNISTQTIIEVLDKIENKPLIDYVIDATDEHFNDLKVDYLETNYLNVGGKVINNGINNDSEKNITTDIINLDFIGNYVYSTELENLTINKTENKGSEKGYIILTNKNQLALNINNDLFNLKPGTHNLLYINLNDKLYVFNENKIKSASIQDLVNTQIENGDHIINIEGVYNLYRPNEIETYVDPIVNLNEKIFRHVITINSSECYIYNNPILEGQIVFKANVDTTLIFPPNWRVYNTILYAGDVYTADYVNMHDIIYLK